MRLRAPALKSAVVGGLFATVAGIAVAQQPAAPARTTAVPELPPLDELAATRARPLFSHTRRPPVVVRKVVTPDAPKVVTSEDAPVELTGIVVAPERTYAILKSRATKEVHHLQRGESIDDWNLDEIGPRHILLRHGESRIRVELFEQNETDGAKPNRLAVGGNRPRPARIVRPRPPSRVAPRFTPPQPRRVRPTRPRRRPASDD